MQLCSLGGARVPGKALIKGQFNFRNVTKLQDVAKCSPTGRDCIEKNSIESFNCSVTCEGIYADVQMRQMKESDERKGEELDKQKYIELISEYKKFKRNGVRHFRFNSSSIFG